MQLFSKKEKNSNKEINKETPRSETYEMVVKHVKRSALTGLAVSALVVVIAAVSVIMPYAVTVDGDTICYVRNKENAANVTRTIIEDYTPEGTTMQAVSMDGDYGIEAVNPWEAITVDCVSVDDAVAVVKERIENPEEFEAAEEDKENSEKTKSVKSADNFVITAAALDESAEKPQAEDVESGNTDTDKADTEKADADISEDAAGGPSITIVSTAEVTENYKAKTKYIKDDSMLAGSSEVQEEGKEGTKEVLRQYTSVNGEVTETTDLQTDIIEEAEPKVIVKGTLGLPDGEDWKTYEGDPVFNDGEALIKTALNYLGTPYKLGGKSLTSGIDCFQFIRAIYAKYGINLPHSKKGMDHVGVGVSFADAQPGDIIVYPHHYALYMGDNTIVHATSKGGVKVRHGAHFMKIVSVRRIPRN